MGIFSFWNKKPEILPADEAAVIVKAIKEAERTTSGEVRVFIERTCKFVDPLDRAAEIFWSLKMDHTEDRNAVLIYVAMKDHQYAVVGDKGIHEKLGSEFWQNEVRLMGNHFKQNHYVDALVQVINDVGQALALHFPYDHVVDRNELPDEIIFGH